MMQSKATEEKAKTSVWWYIDTCKIPEWCDAGRIHQCIKGALEKLGHSGPVTIAAFGNLNKIPQHVLRVLSATGISLNHHHENAYRILASRFFDWRNRTDTPATMMVIADPVTLDLMFYPFSSVKIKTNFHYVLASVCGPYALCTSNLLECYGTGLFWPSEVIEGARIPVSADVKQEETTRGKFLLEKCSQTSESGESGLLVCLLCLFSSQSFESFTMHFSSQEHLKRDDSNTGYLGLTEDKVNQANTSTKKPKKKSKKKKKRKLM